MGCTAEVIALDDVRASQARQALRERLHEHFDRWLDELIALLPKAEATLAQLSDAIWSLRQGLTSGIAQTIAMHQQQAEHSRRHLACPVCEQDLQARPVVARTCRLSHIFASSDA